MKELQIIRLYNGLSSELARVKGEHKPTLVKEYANSLAKEKCEMLTSIFKFRNAWVNAITDESAPKLPDNYQEWMEFLKAETEALKNS